MAKRLALLTAGTIDGQSNQLTVFVGLEMTSERSKLLRMSLLLSMKMSNHTCIIAYPLSIYSKSVGKSVGGVLGSPVGSSDGF